MIIGGHRPRHGRQLRIVVVLHLQNSSSANDFDTWEFSRTLAGALFDGTLMFQVFNEDTDIAMADDEHLLPNDQLSFLDS
jgi:hypothetical protein